MHFYLKILLTLLVLSLTACGSRDNHSMANKQEVITLAPKKISTSLFYSGVIQPLKAIVITNPADGVVADMLFHYGDAVKKGQLLFIISSEKFQSDYKIALMDYIKAKNEFNTTRSQLMEGKFLHNNQLISDDDFKTKQNLFYTSQLSLVQAKETLHRMLKQLTVQGFNMDTLTIENIDKITEALHTQGNSQKLRVTSPAAGVILLPSKCEGDTDNKKIGKGDQIKQGDVLAMVGDTLGLTIRVNVNEFNINQLKMGQTVKVTGAAFPDLALEGKISGIDKQAQSISGGMPVFPIEIIVPRLTPEEQKIIHIGMSAKVEIKIEGEPEISIPIAAVFEKKGQTFVNTKDPSTGKIHAVQVKTGQTSLDSVVIESNLKVGDEIVFTR